jgi:xanthine dehydrogenase small subunit
LDKVLRDWSWRLAVVRHEIRLTVNGRSETVSGVAPHTTVLNWLRSRGMTATKEGCAEGDCGACTVMLGTPKAEGGFDWRASCSCILVVPQLDGHALITAEGLKDAEGKHHPAQALMAEGGGTQCGYCTPGFVMALANLSRQTARDDETILDAISGNLCRCTGYRPIIEAARAMPVVAAPATETKDAVDLAAATRDGLLYTAGGVRFIAPNTVDEAVEAHAEHPDAWILAGGTDLGLRITKRHEVPPALLWLGRIEALKFITETAGGLSIGAGVTYEDALPAFNRIHPELGDLVRRIGGAQIRSVGTMGGNLGNASPIGDSMPALIALGAEIEIAGPRGKRRRVPAADFITGYRKTVLAADELIFAIHIPKLHKDAVFRAYKVARRIDQDISAVCGAFRLRIEGGTVVEAVSGWGGVAARPVPGASWAAALLGKPWTVEAMEASKAALLAKDVSPISDFRGGADYRKTVCDGLVQRFWHETTGDVPAASLEAV